MENFMTMVDSVFYVDYSIVTIIAVYTAIKILERFKPTWICSSDRKKLVTVIVSIGIAYMFHICFDDEPKKLLVSAFLSIIAYDYLIKKLLTTLHIK